MECALSYIQSTHACDFDLWIPVLGHIDFVLPHLGPNCSSWDDTKLKDEMRRSAVLANLIPNTDVGHARLSFVTEGEASLHFFIQNELTAGAIKVGWLVNV
jgi:hypothetical protein